MSNNVEEPATVSAILTYITPPADGSKPYTYKFPPPEGTPVNNGEFDPRKVQVENLRGREDLVSLDVHGFQYGVAESKHKGFTNDEDIKREYYPESIELLKKVTGASKIVLFDHTLRRRIPQENGRNPNARQPAGQAHVDQTAAAAVRRVRENLPADEAEAALGKRFQIINLWWPVAHAAYDWPLALCDYGSVNDTEDLIPTDIYFSGRKGEVVAVRWREEHRWKYVRGMRPDEYVMIKCYDSKAEGLSVFTPHTAFEDPTTPKDAPLRESIELRALVFYE